MDGEFEFKFDDDTIVSFNEVVAAPMLIDGDGDGDGDGADGEEGAENSRREPEWWPPPPSPPILLPLRDASGHRSGQHPGGHCRRGVLWRSVPSGMPRVSGCLCQISSVLACPSFARVGTAGKEKEERVVSGIRLMPSPQICRPHHTTREHRRD
uniref:Uncharacterized protein n=1 Tax=Oryza glumipatula TaxID=40148 RepID=A0A0E0BA40_9ORYZ